MEKLAKQRLRTGFWEECKESVNESVNKAKADGENSSNVIRYYKTRVTRVISGYNEQKESFYLKVKSILDAYGEVSYIIGRLCDLEYMKTLNFQQREKYLSEIAAQYRECRERYDQEKKFDLSRRIS
jgi:hypothetical protein